MSIPRPPLNPDLAEAHKNAGLLQVTTQEERDAHRTSLNELFTVESLLLGKEDTITYTELDIPGPAGPMRATIFAPKHRTRPAATTPGILHIHGGGLTVGNRFMGLTMLDCVEALGAICVTAEYRLAPDHPQPAALEDTYAALQWMSTHAHDPELAFNPDLLVVAGGSAGGNLAAGVALLARDRAGPAIRAQMLLYPWLDDAVDEWLSVRQYGDIAPVTAENLRQVTDFAFGQEREFADEYTVPMRAARREGALAGLPEAWIDVGEADIFRDQDVAYASALWRDGVAADVHVWPGAWHGFDVFVPDARVSRRAKAARVEWLRGVLET